MTSLSVPCGLKSCRLVEDSMPFQLKVQSGEGDYPVLVEPGVLSRLPLLVQEHAPAHRYAVISDDRVAELHGERVSRDLSEAGMDSQLFTFPEGERNKTRKTWSILTDSMLEAGFGRDSVVVAVGGGVTGDLAGFVASTFMRGVPVVQVPTSLLAMIDASVGGKTGVDTSRGKNLVGAFHPPRLVAVDPEVIQTLPRCERAQGLVEAFKHGAICDDGYFACLERDLSKLLDASIDAILEAVVGSVQVKASVVSRDEREGGIRKILNFGHTLGHGIEAAAEFQVPHGTAVGLGMVLEARVGEELGVTEAGTAEHLAKTLHALEIGVGIPDRVRTKDVIGRLKHDKKAVGGVPELVLLSRIGEVSDEVGWTRPLPFEIAERVLNNASREA